MFFNLAGQQKLPGYVAFFGFKVAVELNNLHAVQKGGRDGVQGIGRGDEEDLGEVVLQIQVMVHEGIVLLWVQHFQQG